MRRGRILGLILAAGALAGQSHPVRAADGPRTARASARDAAYLEDAFRHDLCTRDDRALRTRTLTYSLIAWAIAAGTYVIGGLPSF